tara:strand:+ start:11170 stop:12579 length:1410 start_codon:yes stop_codon:yes gene_type:complete
MTVNFVTAKTGIFARLGKIFGVCDRLEDFQTDIVDNASKSFQEAINEFVNTLGATSNTDLDMATSLLTGLDDLRNTAAAPVYNRLRTAAMTTLITMMDDDAKLPIKSEIEALRELRDQMVANSQTVDGTTITLGTPSVSGTGNGTVVASVEPDNLFHRTVTQFPTARTELIKFTCIRDATSRNVVKGGEIFRVEGDTAYPATDHRWPGGSGSIGSMAAFSDNLSDGIGVRNMLRNSNFENWNADTPTGWSVATGSAGTHVVQDSSVFARGSNSLKMVSDGSTLIRCHQQFNSTLGTPAKPHVDGLYVISLLARKSGTTSSAGSLRVGLAQSDGTIVSNSTFNTAHGSISASAFTHLTHSFRAGGTGLSLPSELFFMLQQSTAFTNGTNLHIDGLVFAHMHQTAAGGVALAILPGSTDFIVGDTITVQVTNNGEGEMERFLDKFFDLHRHGIFMPQDLGGSETVADTLIS